MRVIDVDQKHPGVCAFREGGIHSRSWWDGLECLGCGEIAPSELADDLLARFDKRKVDSPVAV